MTISGTTKPILEATPALRNRQFVVKLVAVSLLLFFLTWLGVASNGLFNLIDEPVNRFFMQLRQEAPEWVNGAEDIIVRMGSEGLAVATAVLLIIFAFRKKFHQFWLLLATVGGGELVWLALIFAIDRPRPTEVRAINGVELPGFPSGHVMLLVTFFGALLYLYLMEAKNRPRPRTIPGVGKTRFLPSDKPGLSYKHDTEGSKKPVFYPFTGTLLAVVLFFLLFTGVNRLYFGSHYLTDVIAGYAMGFAWTPFALTVIDWLWLRRQSNL